MQRFFGLYFFSTPLNGLLIGRDGGRRPMLKSNHEGVPTHKSFSKTLRYNLANDGYFGITVYSDVRVMAIPSPQHIQGALIGALLRHY